MTAQYNPTDFFVDPDICLARTLPGAAFTDPRFLQLEEKTIFSIHWLLVPPDDSFDKLAERGANAPFTILGKPFFFQRDLERKLHCFPNVCTHAWHPLVEAAGQTKTITCPQHGRKFDCEGKFLSHMGFQGLENFPAKEDHLRDLPVEHWDPFYFVAFSNPTVRLDDTLREVRDSVGRTHAKGLKRIVHNLESRELDGNWKQHAWNYMDNYHIRFVHKGPEGLAGAVDLSSYKTQLYDWTALQWVYAKKPEHGFDPSLLPSRFRDTGKPDRRVFALWWFVYPNLTLNYYPWGLSVNVYMPVPGKPDRTLFHWHHYVLDEKKYEMRDNVWLDRQVDEEDVEAIANVNRGVQSGFAPRGRFAPKEEAGPHWLHRKIYESVFETNTR